MGLLAYLRADVSDELGLGHISRAIAMGRALERSGIAAVVFCRRFGRIGRQALQKIERNRDIVRDVPSEEEFLAVLARNEARLLFVDLVESPRYAELLKGLRSVRCSYYAVCFDKFYDEALNFDLYIGPSFDGTCTHPNGISGLKYFVFPDEFRALVPKKSPVTEIRRVLISLGGRDPFGMTPKIVGTICPLAPELKFSAVIGPSFAPSVRDELKLRARDYRNLDCIESPDNLGELYMAADIGVISGGQTKFEAGLFGIPTLIVANSEAEEELSKQFEVWGLSVLVGRADRLEFGRLVTEFKNLRSDKGRLSSMSQKGREMLDIHGGERVIEHIKRCLP